MTVMIQADEAEPAAARPRSLAPLLFVRIPYLLGGVLLLTAIAINMVNVIGRYVFAAPVFWAEEVLMFMIIWGVYITAGSITYLGTHVTMDLFAGRLRSSSRALLGLLTVILTVACSAFVVTQTLRILALHLSTGEATMAARVPLVYAHSAVLVGYALMGVVALIRVRAYVTSRFD
jgi:TRAP-type C4-dicarboxylate transport system permease small subunit